MNDIVYHGSNNGNIKELVAHTSTHQKKCIYATPYRIVALLFIGKGNGDLDTCIGNFDGKLGIVERREGVFDALYNHDGYLYELDGSSFNHYDYLWSKEVISFLESIKPLKKIYIPNVWEEILKEEKLGNIDVMRYPERPKEMPLDNSDLIPKYIAFEKKGLKGAVGDLLRVYPELASRVEEAYPEYFSDEKNHIAVK